MMTPAGHFFSYSYRFHKLGQIFSNIWKFLRPEARIESPKDDIVDEKLLKSHCIDINDHHAQSISCLSTVKIVGAHDQDSDLSTPHTVIHLNSGNEEDYKKTNEVREESVVNDHHVQPKARIETPREDFHEKQLKNHCMEIYDHYEESVLHDHHVHPISEIIESYDNNLNLSAPRIVVDSKKGVKTKKRKETVNDDFDEQVIPVIALDKKVTTAVVNRLSSVPKKIVKKIGQYNSTQRLLLVGEGDFSFSASLAVAFGTSAQNITATSLNSEDFLKENYAKFKNNKAELITRGSMVVHGVDATNMLKHPVIGSMVFDRIIFNFPHAGKFGHSDIELRLHQKLVRGFFKNSKKMIGEDGEIHITSKSNGFYLKWDIPKIGSDHSLKLIQEMKFQRSKYPGYNTKYGFGGDEDFNCNPSKTYKFARLHK